MRGCEVIIENIPYQTLDGVPEKLATIMLSCISSPGLMQESDLLSSIAVPGALGMDVDVCRRIGGFELQKIPSADTRKQVDTFSASRAVCLNRLCWNPVIVDDVIRDSVNHLNLFMHEGEYIGAMRNAIILHSLISDRSDMQCVQRMLGQVSFFAVSLLANIGSAALRWEIHMFRWISGWPYGER